MLIKNIEIWVTKDTQKPDFLKKCMSLDLLLYTIWKLRLRASKWCATCLWDFFLTETKESPLYIQGTRQAIMDTLWEYVKLFHWARVPYVQQVIMDPLHHPFSFSILAFLLSLACSSNIQTNPLKPIPGNVHDTVTHLLKFWDPDTLMDYSPQITPYRVGTMPMSAK